MAVVAGNEEPKIALTIEEQALLVAIDDIHRKKLPKFEAKQLITDDMRNVAMKVGVPELVFEKAEVQELTLDQEKKAKIAKNASKFKSEKHIIEQQRQKKHICKQCGNISTLRCGLCGKAWYCSKECQTLHWRNTHKAKCSGYKPKPAAISPPTTAVTPAPVAETTNVNAIDP